MTEADILILGSGPAGLAAAQIAGDNGAIVTIIDEQASPGGQIYRSILDVPEGRAKLLGNDYQSGHQLATSLANSNVNYIARATIWRVDEDGTVTYSVAGKAHQTQGRHVIIATGALERPVPIAGWTLPGVMTAGAAQILLKSSGMVPERAVLAGCGPLLYLVAAQLIRTGTPPKAIIETQSMSDLARSLRFLTGAIRRWRDITKGWEMLREITAAGVRRFSGAKSIEIDGRDCVEKIRFTSGGQEHEIECDTILLHAGVVPNTQITRSLRLDHNWNSQQRCFHPVVDEFGVTSNPKFSVAGDGAGIGGAKAAALRGERAALHTMAVLGFAQESDAQKKISKIQNRLSSELAIRPFLDTLYPPPAQCLEPSDETIVCRCEEVTAGAIRALAKLGCTGPNQTKSFARCGMGPCQGRYCGLTVTEILSKENTMDPQEVGSYRIRAPLKPITLEELASLVNGDDDEFQ
jgi:NADPH-dependent 2,4-dienoyl-CoA reductase/sulfur reductase-like enzyme